MSFEVIRMVGDAHLERELNATITRYLKAKKFVEKHSYKYILENYPLDFFSWLNEELSILQNIRGMVNN